MKDRKMYNWQWKVTRPSNRWAFSLTLNGSAIASGMRGGYATKGGMLQAMDRLASETGATDYEGVHRNRRQKAATWMPFVQKVTTKSVPAKVKMVALHYDNGVVQTFKPV